MKKWLLAAIFLCTGPVLSEEAVRPVPEKSKLCVACHGDSGNSANPVWPNIAGQHRQYALKQLQDFKKGQTRYSPEMQAIVSTLSDADMKELADYYENLKVAEGTVPENYLKRGEALYRGGDFEQHITACIACHGPQGTGNGDAGFPLLSGQHAEYTVLQLQAFKDKKRSNDLNEIMRDISARMSEEDMKAVAFYIQGLY